MKLSLNIFLIVCLFPFTVKAQTFSGQFTGVCPDQTYTYQVNMGSCEQLKSISCTGCYDKNFSPETFSITLKWLPGAVSRSVSAELMCSIPDDEVHGDRLLPQSISSGVTLADGKNGLFACEDQQTTVYIARDKAIPESHSNCSSTQIKATLTRDADYPNNFAFKGYPFDRSQTSDNTGIKIEKVTVSAGVIRPQLTLYWLPGWKGQVKVSIEFQKRTWNITNIFGSCDTDDWKELVSYDFTRGDNPHGSLQGDETIPFTGSEAVINLSYQKSATYPGNVLGVRYSINGSQIAEKLSCTGNISAYSLSYRTSSSGPVTFTTQLQDQCGRWWNGPSKTVTVMPSCSQDNIVASITGTDFQTFPEGYLITKDIPYTVSFTGTTDFDNNYNISFGNGETDMTISGKTFTPLKGIGKYQIDFIAKPGRESCPDIEAITVFLNGKDETIPKDPEKQNCPVALPDDFSKFGFQDIDPGNIVLEHYAGIVKSKSTITVKPGVTLALGAEIILLSDPAAPLPPEPDLALNFIQSTSYDEFNRVLGESRNYFDENGRSLQSQVKSLADGVLMATATIYDAYGRPSISTLPAPVDVVKTETNTCDNTEKIVEQIRFAYKPDFIKAADGYYRATHFDLTKEENPDPLQNTEPGTLGWYYSLNNGTAPEDKKGLNEEFVAATSYPYSRTLFYHDGTGEVKGTTRPGDVLRAGSGHIATSKNEAITAEDHPYLDKYFAMRKEGFSTAKPAIEGQFYRNVAIDENGMKSVAYSDKGGKAIISLYFADQSSPVSKSYQFYDDVDRLIVSVSPNGVEQFERTNNPVTFSQIDKTSYTYNFKGWLLAMEETDAGRTEYVYRKDGKIRFSQNAEQRKRSDQSAKPERYSYTNYDVAGRPVESGEYIVGATGISFDSGEMKSILETTALDGGLNDSKGTRSNRIKTFYDKPGALPVTGRIQRFIHGAVSYTHRDDDGSTSSDNVTTWYSYDESGRIEWMIQKIEALGANDVKTLDYRYGPTGAVQEVLYQKDVQTERFTHFYEHDKSGRLFKAYTTREKLEYNKQGEITNAQVLELQATYDYYIHGPLKRIVYANNLQGIDYTYTADGALKGINDSVKKSGEAGIDPGKDATDVFGMTIDYYSGDYLGKGYTPASVTYPEGTSDRFSGTIKGIRWHSPIEGNKTFAYAFKYDNRYQFKKAQWGNNKNGSIEFNTDSYEESMGKDDQEGYDKNGNIRFLDRKNDQGKNLATFEYNYFDNTNKLEAITNSEKTSEYLRKYQYNLLGQLIEQKNVKAGTKQKIEYDVTGKVTAVRDKDNKLVTTFSYDDRGFRINKTTYNETGDAKLSTWYIRDASGVTISTYEDDLSDTQPPRQTEIPVYASGRIGLYKPQYGFTFYELADHLGNVRAVIGDNVSIEYLATMEAERSDVEQCEKCPFINLKTDASPTYINHTPYEVTVDGQTYPIENPNQVIRLNNAVGTEKSPVGGGIILPVYPGDKINAEVYAKYQSFDQNNKTAVTGIAAYLATTFGPARSIIDGVNIFNGLDQAPAGVFKSLKDIDETLPKAFMTYIVYDRNFVPVKFDYDQVSTDAKIPDATLGEGDPFAHEHERLALEDIVIEKEGFIYIYVSNQSDQNMEVFFDDLRVSHEYSNIVAGNDYYPFGLEIEDRRITRENYGFGYQGQFAEKDEETGWNHFELREYDPVIGRWTTTDPEGQFSSPYVGMGNNPVSGVDPDGGYLWGLFGSTRADRQAARAFRDQFNGEILNITSRNISVIYTSWDYSSEVFEMTGDALEASSGQAFNIVTFNGDGGVKEITRDGFDEQALRSKYASGQVDFDPLGQLTFAPGFGKAVGIPIRAGLIFAGRVTVTAAGRYALNQSVRNFASFMTKGEMNAFRFSTHAGVRSMMRGKGIDAAFRYYAGKNLILQTASKFGFVRLGGRTFGADLIGTRSLSGYWWDVTTRGAWNSHVLKYGSGGRGLIYK